jgi:hypothetical protein
VPEDEAQRCAACEVERCDGALEPARDHALNPSAAGSTRARRCPR